MNKLPIISVVITTWFPERVRSSVVKLSLLSWIQHLKYSGDIEYLFCDDGTDRELIKEFSADFVSILGNLNWSCDTRKGVGASLNRGFKWAFTESPIVLYMVDDWALTTDFNIDSWVDLLVRREDVGMVRLGPPHPNITGKVEAFTDEWQSWGLRMDRQAFAFGHRPALYHKRMVDAYGWFAEGTNALECERLYAEKFNNQLGPDIVLALPHPYQHLDSIELAYIEPKGI